VVVGATVVVGAVVGGLVVGVVTVEREDGDATVESVTGAIVQATTNTRKPALDFRTRFTT
jgi:hypothetical protein